MNMTVYTGNSSPINVSFVAKQRKTYKKRNTEYAIELYHHK